MRETAFWGAVALRVEATPQRTTVEGVAYFRAEIEHDEHDDRQLELPLARPALRPPARASLVPPVVPAAPAAPDAEGELVAMAEAVARHDRTRAETVPCPLAAEAVAARRAA